MTLTIVILIVGLVLLYFGAEGLVRGSSSLALRLGVGPLLVGLTVVAFGTSTPELVVSLKAAYLGQGDISVGNVVGSNICNIGLILGFSALIIPIKVASQIVRVDTPIMIGVTALALFCLHDGSLSRVEGIVLFVLLVAYVLFSIRLARQQATDPLAGEFSEEIKISKWGVWQDIAFIVAGLVMLVFGARFLVEAAIDIAKAFGLSEAVIGLTIVALGTSLPEFATSLVAALKKEADIAVGNVVGSNIFNILGILGISSAVTPLSSAGITDIDLGVMAGFAVVLWIFSRTGFRITRIEGLILLVGYVGYISWLILRS
ncbi:MAG: calcium/sodium antiporter [Chthoniobacterales bacterium]